jgi:hypothetical protein
MLGWRKVVEATPTRDAFSRCYPTRLVSFSPQNQAIVRSSYGKGCASRDDNTALYSLFSTSSKISWFFSEFPFVRLRPMQPKLAVAPAVELSEEQLEIVGQINDLAYENPDQTFEQLMQRVGIKFANEPSFEMFLPACREVFDRERL